jgi:hypothetical protein
MQEPVHAAGQLALPFGLGAAPEPSGPREFRVGGRVLRTSACFDTYWQFAAARQDVFHRRAAGAPPPWTADPVLSRYRFTNVYRAADRVSQHLIRNVIYAGPQDPDEVVFRVLLCKIFNRIETWELLARYLGECPSWAGYSFSSYARILGEAIGRGEPVYSAAYIMPTPPFGERRKYENHLRLLEHAMAGGLSAKVAAAGNLRAVYELLLSLPSIGPFLAYQYAVDLAYSPVTGADESQFVVAGPGALDGISKCFADTGGLTAAGVIAWMLDTSRDHFARLGLSFGDLWGRWPCLIDWQNVFCEVSKYTRVTHPHIPGLAGRTRIKQEFRQASGSVDYRFPPNWGLPAERTVQLKRGT